MNGRAGGRAARSRGWWLASAVLLLVVGGCRGPQPGPAGGAGAPGATVTPGAPGGPTSQPALPGARGARGPFTFAVMGCAHLGICEAADLKQAVEAIRRHRPAFVQLVGSTVDVAGRRAALHGAASPTPLAAAEIAARWREYDAIVAPLGVPVHELASEDTIPGPQVVAAGREFQRRFGARWGAYVHGNNLFVRLDSEARESRNVCGFVDGAQYEFLAGTLADAAKYDNVFVFMAQSAWTQHDSAGQWWRRIHPLLNGKVKFVFTGSAHYLDQIQVQDVRYTATGMGACRPERNRGRPQPHFLLVTVDGQDVKVRAEPLGPVPEAERARWRELQSGVGLAPSFTFHEPAEAGMYSHLTLLGSSDRDAYLRPAAVLAEMRLAPGMKVLDVGAGVGFFTYRLAAAQKGQLAVVATETDPRMVEFLDRRARELGHQNVKAVTVEGTVGDPFKGAQRFDRILLSSVYSFWTDHTRILKELGDALGPGGRIVMLHERPAARFMAEEFEAATVLDTLRKPQRDDAVLRRLSPRTRELLGKGPASPTEDRAFLDAFVADLNAMLGERRLFADLVRQSGRPWYKPQVRGPDERLAFWLVALLEARGVLDRGLSSPPAAGAEARRAPLDPVDRDNLERLNRLLLMGLFRTRHVIGATTANLMALHPREHVLATAARAGLTLEREVPDLLPYHYVLVFKR